MGFEWQIGEAREESDALPDASETTVSRRRWPVFLLGFLLVASLVALVLAWQLNQRVTQVSHSLRNDVLASHKLLRKATLTNDLELFQALLSTQDEGWYRTQQKLMVRQLHLDRAAFGLQAQTAVAQSTTPYDESSAIVDLSPDLTLAEVRFMQPYLVELSAGVTETVMLQHTVVYQRQGEQWLLAPHEDETAFWGPYMWQDGQYLRLFFPTRDQEVGHRLTQDLDNLVGRICYDLASLCPDDFLLQLRLTRDLDSLLLLGRRYDVLTILPPRTSHYSLSLPAPTLIGQPVDEAGYQALYHGYARWVTAVLLNQFSQQLSGNTPSVDERLTQLELKPPGVTTSWPAQPLKLSSMPPPEQDVQVFCVANQQARLLRYNPATGVWIDELAEVHDLIFTSFLQPSHPAMTPFPDDSGVLLHLYQIVDGQSRWRTFSWVQGIENVVYDAEKPPHFSRWLSQMIDPGERYLVDEFWMDEEKAVGLLDLYACQAGTCTTEVFDGLPIWSPDKKQALIWPIGQNSETLYRSDGRGQFAASIGPGWSPFWFDSQTYGYINPRRISDENIPVDTEVVTAVVANNTADRDERQVLLRSDDLRMHLPEKQRPPQLVMMRTFVNPGQRGQLFIYAAGFENDRYLSGHLFLFNRRTQEISQIWALNDERMVFPPAITANGRYLTLGIADPSLTLLIYDLEKRQNHVFHTEYGARFDAAFYDWSADGQWLIISEVDTFKVIAPALSYEQSIFYPIDGCSTAVWVNRP